MSKKWWICPVISATASKIYQLRVCNEYNSIAYARNMAVLPRGFSSLEEAVEEANFLRSRLNIKEKVVVFSPAGCVTVDEYLNGQRSEP